MVRNFATTYILVGSAWTSANSSSLAETTKLISSSRLSACSASNTVLPFLDAYTKPQNVRPDNLIGSSVTAVSECTEHALVVCKLFRMFWG